MDFSKMDFYDLMEFIMYTPIVSIIAHMIAFIFGFCLVILLMILFGG